jgi:hypothetical protein
MSAVVEDGPKISAEQVRRNREVGSDHWLFGWRIQNLTEQPIRVLAARCPHGQFRSEERFFEPPLQAAAGKSTTIEMSVRCDELAGAVIENGFLILLVEWLDKHWRIFVRLRVIINEEKRPETLSELITTQQVGFSGISS